MKTTRDLLAELEAATQVGDELMTRLLQDLAAVVHDRSEVERLHRYASIARSAAASLVVEAAFALRDASERQKETVLQ